MSDDMAVGLLAGGTLATILLLCVVFYVFVAIAFWKIFTKAGIPGWKSLIPVYNVYLIFQMSWKTKWFWVALALCVVGGIVAALFDPVSTTHTYTSGAATASVTTFSMGYAIGELIAAVGSIIIVASWYFVAKSFGKGVGFFILTLFFFEITMLYLGFSKAQYIGNTTKA